MDLSLREDFMNLTTKQGSKGKNKWDYIRLKSFCKRNCQQNKKATNRMGEDIYKEQLQQDINIKNI